jgi:O-antigen biosynthesis protein
VYATGESRNVEDDENQDGRLLDHLRAKLRHVERQRALLADRLLAAEQVRAREITSLGNSFDETQARLAELQDQLSDVLSSQSWRVTAPLRAIGNRLRRIASRAQHGSTRSRAVEVAKPFVPTSVRRYVRRRFPGLVYVQPRAAPVHKALKAVLYVSGAPEVSKRYRCDHQAEQLELLGATVEVAIHGKVDLVAATKRYRHFVLHRVPWGPDIEEFLDRARALEAVVVFDTDDLVFDPDVMPHVAALEDMSRSDVELYEEGLHRYRRTLQSCDAVSVSTESLAEQAARIHDRVFVTPNVASEGMVRASDAARPRQAAESQAEPRSDVTIGYLSGTNTHKKDFLEASDALLAVLESRPQARLLVVGPLALDSRFERFASRIERRPLQPWARLPAMQASVDVNLAPLEPNNPFTDSKSSVKWIEASLVGVPTIASPRPDFRRVIGDGQNGLLAETPAEWERALTTLADAPEVRERIGRRAREDALRSHTSRATAPHYYDTLLRVVSDSTAALTINWIMQSPIARTSGGYRNIFRIAHELGSRGHRQRLYIDPVAHLSGLSSRRIRSFIHESFGIPPSAEVVVGHEDVAAADVSIATFWPTAFNVAAHTQSLFKAYFIQDFEPEFYEQDDLLHSEAARTYELPLRHICLGKHLGNRLTDVTGLPSEIVDFALDPQFRVVTPPEERAEPVRVLFFARPSLRRRGYEAGLEALRLVKDAQPEAEIVLFGSPKRELGTIPFEARDLGVLDPNAVAEAMNQSHILLTLSLTNISNVPFEGMACGCAVVDLDLPNVATMVDPGRNCLLAPFEPAAMAQSVISLIEDRELRVRLARQGAAEGRERTWARTARMFEESLLRLCFARLERGAAVATDGHEESVEAGKAVARA